MPSELLCVVLFLTLSEFLYLPTTSSLEILEQSIDVRFGFDSLENGWLLSETSSLHNASESWLIVDLCLSQDLSFCVTKDLGTNFIYYQTLIQSLNLSFALTLYKHVTASHLSLPLKSASLKSQILSSSTTVWNKTV